MLFRSPEPIGLSHSDLRSAATSNPGTGIAVRKTGVGYRRGHGRKERHTVNRKNRGVWVATALVCGLALFFLSSLADGEEEEVTLIGKVVEADWDDNGNVIAVELETESETFSISSSGRGDELLSHVGQRVEVVGSVSEDEDGWSVLVVSSYTLLPAEET